MAKIIGQDGKTKEFIYDDGTRKPFGKVKSDVKPEEKKQEKKSFFKKDDDE